MEDSEQSDGSDSIYKVEERCVDLSNAANLQSAKHCFLVLTTSKDKKIKFELSSEGKLEVDYFFLDWTPSDSYRQCVNSSKYSLNQSKSKLEKIYSAKVKERGIFKCRSVKQGSEIFDEVFNNKGYSCQEASRDGFNKLCDSAEKYKRNDVLKILAKASPKPVRFRFMGYDKFHFNIPYFDDVNYDPKSPEKTQEMQDWNSLVLKHWDHWEYYKDMVNYSLQKSANSPITRYFYPFFYQERILKRIFAENMQLLGDLHEEEISQFDQYKDTMFFRHLYKRYKKPEGGLMEFYYINTLSCGLVCLFEAYRARRPRRWWIIAPLLVMGGITSLWQRILIQDFAELVNLTDYALEKRKADVWQAQKFVQIPAMDPLMGLYRSVIFLISDEKIQDVRAKETFYHD